MAYYDKHGDQIQNGATVYFNGKEYIAKEEPDGVHMTIHGVNTDHTIELSWLRAEDIELLRPAETDFEEG